MKLSLLLKSSTLFVALITLSNFSNAQLYQVGNQVGIGISSPNATLHLADQTTNYSGLISVPMLRFESNSTVNNVKNFWDFSMSMSSILKFQRFTNSNTTPFESFRLAVGYVKVFERFKVGSFGEYGTVTTPNNTPGYVLSLGLREFGTTGAWNGSGAALFATNTGEFQVMTNPTGTVSGTANMAGQVRFSANNSGVTVRKDPSKTFVDMTFIDPAQSGSDKRAFTIRAVGANHGSSPNMLEFWDPNNNGQAFFTMPVRIGGSASDVSVTASGYDLYVKGGVRATTVKVDAYVNWPDYVFAPNYDLMSLKETEKFIDQNSHLPGVPSEAEVKKEGIELSEMNAILLKKVEELTLHLIELQKQVNQLQNDK